MRNLSFSKIFNFAYVTSVDALFAGVVILVGGALITEAAWDDCITFPVMTLLLGSIAAHSYLFGCRSDFPPPSRACRRFSLAISTAVTIPSMYDCSCNFFAHKDPLYIILTPIVIALSVSTYHYLGWGIWTFTCAWRRRVQFNPIFLVAVSGAYGLMVLGIGLGTADQLSQAYYINAAQDMTDEELHQTLAQPWLLKKPSVLTALICRTKITNKELRVFEKLPRNMLLSRGSPLFLPKSCNTNNEPYIKFIRSRSTPYQW